MEEIKQEVTVINPITQESKTFEVTSAEALEGVQFAQEAMEQVIDAFNNLHRDYAELNLKVAKLREALKSIM